MIDGDLLNAYFDNEPLSPLRHALVRHYRQHCIDLSHRPAITMPDTDFGSAFRDFRLLYRSLTDTLKGRHVIELGPGYKPRAQTFMEFGATSYVGVEPFHPASTQQALSGLRNVEVVAQDALSYLLAREDNSAVIISAGVIAPEIYDQKNNGYFQFLGREIFRVSHAGALSVHITTLTEREHHDFFMAHGFTPYPYYNHASTQVWKKP